jgi:hypothetical protein
MAFDATPEHLGTATFASERSNFKLTGTIYNRLLCDTSGVVRELKSTRDI